MKHPRKSAFRSILTTQTVRASAVDRFDGRDQFVSFDLVVVVAPLTDDCLLLLPPLLRLPWLAEDRAWRFGAARRTFFAKLGKKVSLTITNTRLVPFYRKNANVELPL